MNILLGLVDNSIECLRSEISNLREEMVSIGINEGLNNPKTIRTSQKLDVILNLYHKILKDKEVS